MEEKNIQGKKRLHFGVVFPTFDNTCQYDVWNGIVRYAEMNDIHVTAYFGTYHSSDYSFAEHYETCMETIKKSSLDGVIMFAGFIIQDIGLERYETLAAKIPEHIPVVSVSCVVPGVPSVLVDNIAGMYSAIEHLIKCHDKKQIAFVKGPDGHPEAEERLEGYKKALADNNITFDERYVLPGNFNPESGQKAVAELLDVRKLPADAIAASDDESAVGVLNELKSRGILVPAEIAVTGFDDDRMSMTFIPSISTVRQSFVEIGIVSARTLHKKTKGEPVKEIDYVKPSFVARQSCGCMEEKFSTEPEGHDAHSFISYVLHGFTFLFREHVPGQQVREWVMDLVEIMKENPFQKDTFLYYIDKILVNYSHYSKDYSVWHEALNILTTGMELYHIEFRCSHSILSALIFATALVHDIRLKGEKVHEFAVSDAHLRLRRIASNLLLLFDVDSLAEEMYSALPALSMDTALIGLYHKPVRNGDKFADRSIDTLIGFDRQQKFNMKYNSWNRINFSDYSTIDGFDFERERRTLFFLPLFFKDDEAGVALLRYDADNTVDAYETIRINISTAVKGAELISKIHTLSITDELTGLLNRRGFFQFVYSRLQHLNRNDELKAIVMFMDMDGLKYINDTYGHTEGDTAISAFAKTLRDALREEDIIGRVGGDEFVVFSSVKSEKNGKQVIARIREKIEEYNTRELHPYRVAASIGSVVLEGNTKEFFEAAMLSADSILYEEKIEKKKQGLSRN